MMGRLCWLGDKMSGATMPFRTRIPVRFGDVDHAGIVYYPHFFIYLHEAFEDFFDAGQRPYHRWLDEEHVGFPTVHIETDYKLPLRYGDALNIELSVPKVGNRSATFRYVCYRQSDGQLACTAEITCACVDMRVMKSRQIPDELRALFQRFAS
jgi:YbgC/YbaW family acyl-CoA thioester hydrolase